MKNKIMIATGGILLFAALYFSTVAAPNPSRNAPAPTQAVKATKSTRTNVSPRFETDYRADSHVAGTSVKTDRSIYQDKADSEVLTRLNMPLISATPDDPALQAEITELYNSGWIIDATVDEVEAALEAAKSTPDPEDDRAAHILAHRASCRYILLP